MVKHNAASEYLKLFRLQTGATTALAPVIGYLVLAVQTGYSIVFQELALIFTIGILMHIFEFVLNEYMDVEVDKRSPDLAGKPLVKGTISMGAALAVVMIALVFSYLLTLLYFFQLWTLILLTIAFEFGAIYDIYGKRFPGSDFTLALWIFMFCLFGASIVSTDFTPLLYLVAGLGFFQILFNNAVEGGIKDADHDAVAGARTLAHALGVSVENKKLKIPVIFKFVSYAIKLGHLSLVVLILYHLPLQINDILDVFQFIMIVLLILIILYTLQKFLNQVEFRRDKLKRIFSVHEIATFFLVPTLLWQLLGHVIAATILFLPLIWYLILNLILYGRPLEPKV